MVLSADERMQYRTHTVDADENAPELAATLRHALRGEVRFDAGSRAL